MAVTKKKLPNPGIECEAIKIPVSVSKFQRVSTTCQCRLGLLLASALRLPAGLLYQVYQRVQFYLENVGPYRCNRNSAISERKSCSLPYSGYTPGTRSGCKHRDAPPGDYFNNFKYRFARSAAQCAKYSLRHTSVKMARLTNFDRKGVQIFFTNKPLTLKM